MSIADDKLKIRDHDSHIIEARKTYVETIRCISEMLSDSVADLADERAAMNHVESVIREYLSMSGGKYTGNIRKDINTIVRDQVQLSKEESK